MAKKSQPKARNRIRVLVKLCRQLKEKEEEGRVGKGEVGEDVGATGAAVGTGTGDGGVGKWSRCVEHRQAVSFGFVFSKNLY